MLRATLIALFYSGLIIFTLSGCTPKPQIVREYVYLPCAVPEIPEAPKYLRVQFQQDAQGMIEFKSNDDAKGLLLNILMDKSRITDLEEILKSIRGGE